MNLRLLTASAILALCIFVPYLFYKSKVRRLREIISVQYDTIKAFKGAMTEVVKEPKTPECMEHNTEDIMEFLRIWDNSKELNS